MAARSAWRGAITFGGFPIHVAAYNTQASKTGEGFKSLCPCHQQPIRQEKVCATTGDRVDNADLLKGVEVTRGDVRMVPNDAAAAINDAERTNNAEILGLPLRAGVPVELSVGHFRIVNDEKVPGSEQGIQLLWNGLRATERCLLTQVTMRAGSKPQILAIEADDHGLTAHALPYKSQLAKTPEFLPVENEQAATMFEQFASVAGVSMDEFHHHTFTDRSKEKRDELIEQALKGEPISVPSSESTPAASAPDLLAAMQAAMDKVKPTTAKPKAKPKAKPRAKASA